MDPWQIKALQEALEKLPVVKTKPIYGKKAFIWEIQDAEKVLKDGIQRTISCDISVDPIIPEPLLDGVSSKWRLVFDVEKGEPAVTVHKIEPDDKEIYFRVSIRVLLEGLDESDIASHPRTKQFYKSTEFTGEDGQKFSLHRELDFGRSYSNWLKNVVVGGSLLLKVNFKTAHSVYY